MTNEELIRNLIRGSIRRAIQESVAALFVIIYFAAVLANSSVGSPRYYGCLIILVGCGFIAGVVWSYALSYRLLRSHSPNDMSFWREAFQAQAKLLRLAPLWYCAPLCSGLVLYAAPTNPSEFSLFLMIFVILAGVFAGVVWLNRKAAEMIDDMARQLVTPESST